ncbi:hypothetical protein EYF80_016224 [Liparis tanakae]|uniref:Uncharacterized protein n=1 Tax=Liparis tanakae TaxID=230148 RepID=A0A4Z2I6E9_9TELE|nr:hypothetical protein EYF80_016224 [Liparis tanakae]
MRSFTWTAVERAPSFPGLSAPTCLPVLREGEAAGKCSFNGERNSSGGNESPGDGSDGRSVSPRRKFIGRPAEADAHARGSRPLAVLRGPLQVFILPPPLLFFLLLLFLAQLLADHVQPRLLPVERPRFLFLFLLLLVVMQLRLLQLQPPLLHQQEALPDGLRRRRRVAGAPEVLLGPGETRVMELGGFLVGRKQPAPIHRSRASSSRCCRSSPLTLNCFQRRLRRGSVSPEERVVQRSDWHRTTVACSSWRP